MRQANAKPYDFSCVLKKQLGARRQSADAEVRIEGQGDEEKAGASSLHFEWLAFQWLSLLRVSLTLAGLLLTPSWQSPQAALFLAYLLYGCLLYGLGFYRKTVFSKRNLLWIDIAWGIAGASLLLTLIGTGGKQAAWQQMLPGTVGLLIFAYVITQWADLASRHKKYLRLLGILNHLPNARGEPVQLITATLEQLREFYSADQCFSIIGKENNAQVYGVNSSIETHPLPIQHLKMQLISLPEHCAIVANRIRHNGAFPKTRQLINGVSTTAFDEALERSNEISESFGEVAWISIPLELDGAVHGRLYLVSRRQPFAAIDIELLREAMTKFMPLVEIFQRLDRRAIHAVAKERRKISLDLHDGAIQPYLGLKLGLEALRRKAEPGNPLNADIDELYHMTQESIAELRGYVHGLNGRAQRGGTSLSDGLQRQIARFRRFYDFEVSLHIPAKMSINEQLTAEVVQMIGESLSNVGRHTTSRQVSICLDCNNGRLNAQIVNHGGAVDSEWQTFIPKSLTRRAEALGGRVDVNPYPDGGSEVLLSIPFGG